MPASFELLFYVGSESLGKVASYSAGVYTGRVADLIAARLKNYGLQ